MLPNILSHSLKSNTSFVLVIWTIGSVSFMLIGIMCGSVVFSPLYDGLFVVGVISGVTTTGARAIVDERNAHILK